MLQIEGCSIFSSHSSPANWLARVICMCAYFGSYMETGKWKHIYELSHITKYAGLEKKVDELSYTLGGCLPWFEKQGARFLQGYKRPHLSSFFLFIWIIWSAFKLWNTYHMKFGAPFSLMPQENNLYYK